MAKFVERDQSQLYLLPADMRDRVPEDDLSHFVVEARARRHPGAGGHLLRRGGRMREHAGGPARRSY